MRTCYVYIMASNRKALYIGVTSSLTDRVVQHKAKTLGRFSAQYGTDKLVWYEVHHSPLAAIAREKQLKSWRRRKKVELVETTNREWRDLAEDLAKEQAAEPSP
jgi:putative endonuclease